MGTGFAALRMDRWMLLEDQQCQTGLHAGLQPGSGRWDWSLHLKKGSGVRQQGT